MGGNYFQIGFDFSGNYCTYCIEPNSQSGPMLFLQKEIFWQFLCFLTDQLELLCNSTLSQPCLSKKHASYILQIFTYSSGVFEISFLSVTNVCYGQLLESNCKHVLSMSNFKKGLVPVWEKQWMRKGK